MIVSLYIVQTSSLKNNKVAICQNARNSQNNRLGRQKSFKHEHSNIIEKINSFTTRLKFAKTIIYNNSHIYRVYMYIQMCWNHEPGDSISFIECLWFYAIFAIFQPFYGSIRISKLYLRLLEMHFMNSKATSWQD